MSDPEAFLAASIAIFADHQPDLMDKAAFQIVTKSDRPTLRLMKAVLDELQERAIEEEERENRRRQIRSPDPKKNRTPEQQARIDEMVKQARRSLGIPEEGLTRR